MPLLFQKIATVILPYRRALFIGVFLLLVALPFSFVTGFGSYGIYLLPAVMVLWGFIVMSWWYHPASGFLAKGQPRWKRMIAWPGAIGLDFWFAISVASFARVGPLSILP